MHSFINFVGKNILITGASSGIGKQCAITASKLGANIVLIARNEKRLEEVYNQLEKGNHLRFSQDIIEYDKLEENVEQAVDKIGKISGFIHSAGIEMTKPLKVMKPEYYEKLFATNVIAGFELAKLLSNKKYFDKNGASFIFIASVMGVVGNAALVGYSATKGALIASVRSMAIELARRKIRVNCISPGHIQTELLEAVTEKLRNEEMDAIKQRYPLGIGKAEDVANSCMFLLSDKANWITGINMIVDGGYISM